MKSFSLIRFLIFLLLLGPALLWQRPLQAAPPAKTKPEKARPAPAEKPIYIRVAKDAAGKLRSMQTAWVRLEREDGVRVDLVGAVHVGDKSYYDRLNKIFKKYDALLFELVAPEGTKIPKGTKYSSGHPVGAMQGGMKSMLELEHQLECVDYTRKNFVHADMTPDEFAKSAEKLQDGFLQLFFRMMGASAAQQANPNAPNDFDLIRALLSKDRALALKRIMARQMENGDAAMAALQGPDGSTIITERNKKALQVMVEQIEGGKKRLGIFYGAGHLEDMEQRLLKEHGFKRTALEWIDAWDLTDAK